MANLPSAVKRIRSNERKRSQNRIIRSRARTAIVNARASIESGTGDTEVSKAIRELDIAANKGVIHRNNAARRKSRLMKLLNTGKKPKSGK